MREGSKRGRRAGLGSRGDGGRCGASRGLQDRLTSMMKWKDSRIAWTFWAAYLSTEDGLFDAAVGVDSEVDK